jgi:hypothetical protein
MKIFFYYVLREKVLWNTLALRQYMQYTNFP